MTEPEAPSPQTLVVWRNSFLGFVTFFGGMLAAVFGVFCVGFLADSGPGPAPIGFGGISLALASLSCWSYPRAREPLVLSLDSERDVLCIQRGETSHTIPKASGITRAWHHMEEVGHGTEDVTLHTNWILLEVAEPGERVSFPEKFQDSDSRKVVQALNTLLGTSPKPPA